MRGLFSKVLNPLKVRHTLDCIAAGTNYLNKYSHIYVYYKKENRDMSTTKCKIESSKVLQSSCTGKNKNQI